jgi:hypothetical protein
MERFCLGVLLREPELLYRINRKLQALDLERLSHKDFTGTERQVIFHAVREALAQDDEEPVLNCRNRLDAPLLTSAEALLTDVVDIDYTQSRVIEEIMANFLRLRKRNLEMTLTQLRFQLQAAQDSESIDEEGQEEVWRYTREVQRIASQKDRLDRA